MAIQEYALGVGFDNTAGLQNIENLIRDRSDDIRRFVLRAEPVPPGSIQRRTLDKKNHYDGTQVVRWTHGVIPLTGLQAIVNAFIGDFDTDNGAVTLHTRDAENVFSNYNAEMALPQNYNIRRESTGTQIALNVVWEFYIVAEI